MQDSFKRNITYLRLSVTDKCNLRCRYCMPSEGVKHLCHEEIMRSEEMVLATKVCSSLGVKKVRLTGGEPLVRKDIVSLASKIKELDGIETLAITTNGVLLPKYAKELKSAGVDSVNISLDTLNPAKYRIISRLGELDDAIKGIKAALAAGFKKVKINTVLIGGFNDDEIVALSNLTTKWPVDVRFIELMPMAQDDFFTRKSFISTDVVLEKLKSFSSFKQDGVAKLFTLENSLGNVGLISPVSHLFCSDCNRIRITADGAVKPCLHSKNEFNIKGLDEEEMERVIKQAILSKPEMHANLSYDERSLAGRNMNSIGG